MCFADRPSKIQYINFGKKMRFYPVLGIVTIATIADVVLPFFILCHGTDIRRQLILNVYHFNIYTSMLELYVFSLLRICIMTGVIIGLIWNKTEGIVRMKKVSVIILILSVIMWSYTIVKLLVYFEPLTANKKNPWFWSMFAWSLLMSALFYLNWSLLASIKVSSASYNNINSTEETDTDSIDEEEKPKAASITRLLKLSKPDIHILGVAFVFLTICSLGR